MFGGKCVLAHAKFDHWNSWKPCTGHYLLLPYGQDWVPA